MPITYVIDFDSTFTQVEALDELARISLKNHPEKKSIYKKIETLTLLGMEGKLSFRESLHQRINLIQANAQHLKELIHFLKKKISPSFLRNKFFFEKNSAHIHIVSGGFREFIIPIVTPYHIPKEQVHANQFLFDPHKNITGYDQENPLSEEAGKVKLLKKLQLPEPIYGIGDGYSDYQLKESGVIQKFYAFTENIERKSILEKADHITPSLDEFLFINQLPSVFSYPKNRIQCALIGDIPNQSIHLLKKEGFCLRHKKSIEEINLSKINMLLLDTEKSLTEAQLKQAIKLKTIGFLGNSNHKISSNICTQMGIIIFDNLKKKSKNSSIIPQRMIDFINKGHIHASANFPEIQLPTTQNAHRFIHIHENIPEMADQIRTIFIKYSIHILGHFFISNPQISYWITDINPSYNKKIIQDFKKMKHTLQFRVLYFN